MIDTLNYVIYSNVTQVLISRFCRYTSLRYTHFNATTTMDVQGRQLPQVSARWPMVIVLLCAVTSGTGAATSVQRVVVEALALPDTVAISDRNDIMGQRTVTNRDQCERLCWYRKLCSHHSYNPDVTSADANCLLHTDPLQGQLKNKNVFFINKKKRIMLG